MKRLVIAATMAALMISTANTAHAGRGLAGIVGIIAGAAIAHSYRAPRAYAAPRRTVVNQGPVQYGNATRLYSNNGWVVTYFAKSDNGNQMCSMYHEVNGGGVAVKWTKQNGLSVEVTKNQWSLTPGQQANVSVIFDRDNTFSGTAKTGIQASWKLNSLFLHISNEEAPSFGQQFEDADTMTVYVEGNFEQPIRINNMDGSRKAAGWFYRCQERIGS